MGYVAELMANMDLNIKKFAEKIREAGTMASDFAKDLDGKVGNSVNEVDKKTAAWGLNLKSVSRVVSGILISQAFYTMMQDIRQATDAVWEYTKQLEYAHMAYSNLFNDSSLSTEFINVMEDFAAKTTFDFTDVEQAARRLLSYGIQYKNVMYVAQGVLSGASMTGDPASVERVSRAIGQIYSKGKLYQEEVRQLTEASIPAMDILREKLQLTENDISNIGRASIPASVAINALIDGMNERFGTVLEESGLTIIGVFSNIRDNAKMLGSVVFDPLIQKIKEVSAQFGNWLKNMRDIAATRGTGGLLEHLFPPQAQATIRIFIANIMTLANTIKGILVGSFKAWGTILGTVIEAFNALAPVINIVLSLLSGLVNWIGNSTGSLRILTSALLMCAAAWVIFKIQAAGALILTAVKTAISAVSTAVIFLGTVLHTSPAIALLGVLAAVAITVALSFDKARAALKNFTSELLKVTGIDPNSILIPSQKDRAADLGKFSDRLDESADSMGDLGDAASDAAKKAKKAQSQLLSFDEVFRLNKEDEGELDDSVYRVPVKLNLGCGTSGKKPDLEELLPEGIDVGDVPEVTADNFITGFIDNIKKKILDAGIGSIVGAALGFALGGIKGAKIGAAAGALGGLVWSFIADGLNLSDVTRIALPLTTGLGAALAIMLKGIKGGPVGVAIGIVATSLIDGIANGIKTGDWSKVTTPLTASIGAAVGFAVGGIPGAIAGAGLGIMLGKVLEPYTNQIVDGLYTFGGKVYDFFYELGGKVGPAMQDFGAGVYEFWHSVGQNTYDFWYNAGYTLYDTMYNLGAKAQDMLYTARETVSSWLMETTVGLVAWGINTKLSIDTWIADTRENISLWATDTWASFSGWVTNTYTAIATWVTNTRTSFQTWQLGIITTVATWAATTSLRIQSWVNTTKQNITTWATNTSQRISTWASTAASRISTFAANATSAISGFVSSALSSIGRWASGMLSSASTAMNGMVSRIRSGLGNAMSAVTSFCSNALSAIGRWARSVASTIANALSSAASSVGSFVSRSYSSARSTITSWFDRGHATGGIFNREHVARFAEGNKAEAVIPLENASAMQPFVDAISRGLTSSLAPMLATAGGNGYAYSSNEDMRPLYVGTLIADERSLKELERKMQVIRLQEERRGQ